MNTEATTEIAKLDPLKEVKEISTLTQAITEFLAPGALEAKASELLNTYGTLTIAGHIEGEVAGLEAVKSALNKHVVKFRTAIDAEHKRLKAPFWDAGKALDARKKEVTALTAGLEAHLDKEIKDFEEREAKKKKEEEDRIRKVRDQRVQSCMNAGISMNMTDCEQMADDEWQAAFDALKAEKDANDKADRARLEATVAAQKRITERTGIAVRLGKHISAEDAEFLTAEEFDAMREEWVAEFARSEEIASFISRAQDEGFALPKAQASEMDEASFMVWIGVKAVERDKATKAARMTDRAALLEDGEIVSVNTLRDATEEQWKVILAALVEERARKNAPVVAPASPSAPASRPAVDLGLTSGGTSPAAPANVTAEQALKAKADSGEWMTNDEVIALLGLDTAAWKTAFDYMIEDGRIEFDDHRKGSSFWCHLEAIIDGVEWESDTFVKDSDWGVEEYCKKEAKYRIVKPVTQESSKSDVEEASSSIAEFSECVAELRKFGNAWRHRCPDMVQDLLPIVLRFRRALGEQV